MTDQNSAVSLAAWTAATKAERRVQKTAEMMAEMSVVVMAERTVAR